MTRKSSNYVTDEAKAVLEEEIELLDGASAEFDQELVDAKENSLQYSLVLPS